MTKQPYQLQVGEFTCHVIPDGGRPFNTSDLGDRLPTADPEALQAAAEKRHPEGTFEWAYNPLLVQTPDEVILFDAGYGDTNKHVAGLVEPGSVDRVVITHTHGDHVSGLVDDDGNAVYPKAEVVIQSSEWEWWDGEGIKPALAPRLTKVDGEVEIAEGVCLIPAPGHTPGHVAVLLESDGDKLLHLVDTLHAPVQLDDPSWSIAFDADMDLAAETRRTLLGRAADDETLVLLYHFAFPGLGSVRRSGDGFGWQAYEG